MAVSMPHPISTPTRAGHNRPYSVIVVPTTQPFPQWVSGMILIFESAKAMSRSSSASWVFVSLSIFSAKTVAELRFPCISIIVPPE
jgi:hypothetical protein